MDNTRYTITLADGTVLSNLRLNGNNYISAEPVSKKKFEGNLSPATISDGEHEEQHPAMALVHITPYKGETWFTLRDLTDEELWKMKMEANIEYVAMMSDVII